jgi:hypothetical protein
MIRRATVLTSFAVLALAACGQPKPAEKAETPTAPAMAPAESAPVDPDLLTADGIGPIRIGQTIGEVQALSGVSDTPIAAPDACNIFHPARAPAGVFVMTEMGHVTRITLREGATARTDKGFGVGSEASAIKAAYGGGVIVQPAKYDPAPAQDLFVWARGGSTAYVTDPEARGVRYEVGEDGKVKAVHAGGPSIHLAESCG